MASPTNFCPSCKLQRDVFGAFGSCLLCDAQSARVNLAHNFAIKAHGEQRYGDRPYVYHLNAVCHVAYQAGLGSTPVAVAAYLHDTIEDTATTQDDVCNAFGSFVAELVWAVTGTGPTRADRLASACIKIIEFGESAVNLKLCDRIANVEESARTSPRLFAMYCGEANYLRTVFHGYGLESLWHRLDRAYASQGGSHGH